MGLNISVKDDKCLKRLISTLYVPTGSNNSPIYWSRICVSVIASFVRV